MTPFPPTINDPDAVLTNHRMVREDGFWRCVHCLWLGSQSVPPQPCVPRRWADQ